MFHMEHLMLSRFHMEHKKPKSLVDKCKNQMFHMEHFNGKINSYPQLN